MCYGPVVLYLIFFWLKQLARFWKKTLGNLSSLLQELFGKELTGSTSGEEVQWMTDFKESHTCPGRAGGHLGFICLWLHGRTGQMNLKMRDLHPTFSECLVLMIQFGMKIANSIIATLGDCSTLQGTSSYHIQTVTWLVTLGMYRMTFTFSFFKPYLPWCRNTDYVRIIYIYNQMVGFLWKEHLPKNEELK